MFIPITSGFSETRVTLSATYDVSDERIAPANASATFSLESDGDIIKVTNTDGTVDLGNWIRPKSAAGADYDCYATLNSGTLTSGTTGSWLSLGSTQSWNVTRTALGSSVVELTIQIRHASTLAVLDSTVVTITADKS